MNLRRSALIAFIALWSLAAATADAETKPYSPKNGILNLKALILGGGFRVSTAIKLHGNFSKFTHLDIVQPQSLIGKDAPPKFLQELADQLQVEFARGARFAQVRIIDSYDPNAVPTPDSAPVADDFRQADKLEAPIRSAADMQLFDRQRNDADTSDNPPSASTLVIQVQVVDYAKGNKLLQLSMLDIGNAILTLRFSYFDKDTGEELGRSIISSDNSAKVVPSAFSPRTVLSGVVDGLIDQVTRRQVAGER
jgi:hypothetical protein